MSAELLAPEWIESARRGAQTLLDAHPVSGVGWLRMVQRLIGHIDALTADRTLLVQALWDVLREAGFDTDGDTPDALIAGSGVGALADLAVATVYAVREGLEADNRELAARLEAEKAEGDRLAAAVTAAVTSYREVVQRG